MCLPLPIPNHEQYAVNMLPQKLLSRHFCKSDPIRNAQRRVGCLKKPWRDPCGKKEASLCKKGTQPSIQRCGSPNCHTCVLACRSCLSAQLCSRCLSFCLGLQTPGGWPTTSVPFIVSISQCSIYKEALVNAFRCAETDLSRQCPWGHNEEMPHASYV